MQLGLQRNPQRAEGIQGHHGQRPDLHQSSQPRGYAAYVVVGVHLDDSAVGVTLPQVRPPIVDGARPHQQDVAG